VVAIGVDAGDKAAAEAKDPRMELLANALHEDAALMFCQGRHGTRQSPRYLDRRNLNYIYILTSVGRRVAPASGGHRKKSVVMTELAEGPSMSE
jgi:hypothetical protein